MAILLQRMCWNDNGWRGPTSTPHTEERSADSYVAKYGFGHEEWNFSKADALNGLVYGYMYYPQHGQNVSEEMYLERHDIYFFAIDGDRRRWLVGYYRNARFLRLEERTAAAETLQNSGVLQRRVRELMELGLGGAPDVKNVRKALTADVKVVVPPRDIHVLEPLIPLTSAHTDGRDPKWLNRYTTPTFLSSAPLKGKSQSAPSGLSNANGTGRAGRSGTELDLFDGGYVRRTAAEIKVIEPRHNKLSNGFRRMLKQLGAADVIGEDRGIDVRCRIGKSTCLFELKIVYAASQSQSLREALGQLLDYGYSPGRARCSHHAIVLDERLQDTYAEWLRTLGREVLPVEVFFIEDGRWHSAKLTNHPLNELLLRTPH